MNPISSQSRRVSNRTIFIELYGASIFGYLLSCLRDWLVIRTTYAAEYFVLIYLAGIFSTITVNAIVYSTITPTPRLFLSSLLISLLLSFATINLQHLQLTLPQYALVILVFLSWVVGAFYTQYFILKGKYFLARSRDTLASFITSCFSLFRFDLYITTLSGPFIATLTYFFLRYAYSSNQTYYSPSTPRSTLSILSFILCVNAVPIYIQAWGLYYASRAADFTNVDILLLVRLGVYLFQFFSIASFALRKISAEMHFMNTNLVFISMAISSPLSLVLFFIPGYLSSLLFILSSVMLHFALLVLAQRYLDQTIS